MSQAVYHPEIISSTMPGLISVNDPFQSCLEFERKMGRLIQLTVIVHELRSESISLFQSIKLKKECCRKLKNLVSSENVDEETLNKLVTDYKTAKKTCDIDFFYEEGRSEANKDYREKIYKMLCETETWQQRLDDIQEEIGKMNLKIQKQNRRILELKLKSMDVGSDLRLQ